MQDKDNTRLTVATAGRVEERVAGDAALDVRDRGEGFNRPESVEVDFVRARIALYDELKAKRAAEALDESVYPRKPIQVRLKGKGIQDLVVEAVSWSTLPVHLGKGLAGEAEKAFKSVIKDCVVANVYYSERIGGNSAQKLIDSSGVSEEEEKTAEVEAAASSSGVKKKGELWDLLRPLEGPCEIEFLDFDDPKGRAVFWHSSAHVLGECLECGYGCHLTVGPPVKNGFFYDAYMNKRTVDEEMKADIERKAKVVCGDKGQQFERLVVSKEEALALFATNPFKTAMIKSKIPDGTCTTVYRCGPMIDLCMGPHVINTRSIKGFAVLQGSQAYFGGDTANESLQRVYGVSFPTPERLEQHLKDLKEAKENDHRVRGREQELFFFHPFSPGSAFFEPAGARIYNTLIGYIKEEYRARGYQEVITPNIFNIELWKISGHWAHYQENMFSFTDGEEQTKDGKPVTQEQRDASTFALKPMNCPGHCLMFAVRERSYRELPLRLADFGVLHRNELSGALSGLTRVRRFQQDDAHIFCAPSQIKSEVLGALNFMKSVYSTFGMSYKLERSTRPAKANGLDTPEGVALWDLAEQQLAEALDEFQGPGTWRDNPGDGAFYGPKIDIKVFDAQHRMHQCATVQLDFQNPIRFGLEYASEHQTRDRPVMIHRAMLGSVERMMAILAEHFRGRWPFWLSPRQAAVVPMLASQKPEVNAQVHEYGKSVFAALFQRGFHVELPATGNDHHNELMKRAFEKGVKYVLCVGPSEIAEGLVTVSSKHPYGSKETGPLNWGTCPLSEVMDWFDLMTRQRTLDENIEALPFKPRFVKPTFNKKGDAAKKSQEAGGKNEESKLAKRKQEEAVAPMAPLVPSPPAGVSSSGGSAGAGSAPSGDAWFRIGNDVFQTEVKSLRGRTFASVEEYIRALSGSG